MVALFLNLLLVYLKHDSSFGTDHNKLLCKFNFLFGEEDTTRYFTKLSKYPDKFGSVDTARQGKTSTS